MGRARVECTSGCTCKPTVLDGWWERHASLQVMHTIKVWAVCVTGQLAPHCSWLH